MPAAPPDPCARANAAQRALFAGLSVPPGAEPASPEFAACIPTPRGAWSLEIESLRWVADEQAWRGHWSLVHADAAGRLVRIALSLPSDDAFPDLATSPDNFLSGSMSGLVRDDARAVDYDGDGEPELVLAFSVGRHEASDPARGRVWTFRDGRISLYPPSAALDVTRAEDVDRDGRADLIVLQPFVTTGVAEESFFSYDITGPEWVFHSLADGTFSAVDAVAMQAARRHCPSAPGPTLLSVDAVVCARAWGTPTREVLASIGRGCGGRLAVASEGGCEDVDAMRAFANLDAPTRLGPDSMSIASPH